MKQYSNVGFAIPAYRESKNLPILIRSIFKTVPGSYIVVVDDSPKGEAIKTRAVITAISPLHKKHVDLITRESKGGRGSAVLEGFKHLYKKPTIVYFFEMDADLTHNPADCVLFFDAEKTTHADVVVGSRYLPGSSIIKWPARRLILSKIINGCINVWLGLHMSDYTNGFRMYNRHAVSYLFTKNLREKGFIALSESAYLLKKHSFTLTEIPITFTDRAHGISSASWKEFALSLRGIARIRFRK